MGGNKAKTGEQSLRPLVDQCGRPITYLRLSVSDRCNLACPYCRQSPCPPHLSRGELLSYEEMTKLVRVFLRLGIRKVRLTGGEPLLRKNIEALVRSLRMLGRDMEIALTTNGVLLAEKARALAEAGLDSVNVSLDTLDAGKFRQLTGESKLPQVLAGIEAAQAAGIRRIGINTVIMRRFNLDEVRNFLELALESILAVRFIELIETKENNALFAEEFVSSQELVAVISRLIPLVPVTSQMGPGSTAPGPARYLRIKGTKVTLGFVSPLREDFCDTCNRVRVDHRGILYPCLFSPGVCDLRAMLRSGMSEEELAERMVLHVRGKRWERSDYENSRQEYRPDMFQLGG